MPRERLFLVATTLLLVTASCTSGFRGRGDHDRDDDTAPTRHLLHRRRSHHDVD
jgi:hypothetical protein